MQYVILPLDSSVYVSTMEGGVTRRFYKYGSGPAPSMVNDLYSGKNISVSPNPASTELHFDLPSEASGSMLTVYDQTGRMVLKEQISDNNKSVSIRELANGLYLAKVTKEGFQWHIKFVKQ